MYRQDQSTILDGVREGVDEIWRVTLARPIREFPIEDIPNEGHAFQIAISGACNLTLTFCVSKPLANAIASHIFDLSDREPIALQIDDCLREIANVIGGHLKTALPEPCVLSFPRNLDSQVFDSLYSVSEALTISFRSEGEPFLVVIQQNDNVS